MKKQNNRRYTSDDNEKKEYDNIVGIWLGKFESQDALLEYTDFVYNEDGFMFAPFSEDIGGHPVEEEFMEGQFYDGPITFEHAIKSYSYAPKYSYGVTNLYKRKKEFLRFYNSIILVFGQRKYEGENNFLFTYNNRVKKGAPIQFLCKWEF